MARREARSTTPTITISITRVGEPNGRLARLTGMQCEQVRELLSAVVDGEATVQEQAIVDAHLATCAECRAWQERAHTLQRWSRVRALAGDAEPDPAWLGALVEVVPARRRRTRVRLD